MPFQKGHQLSKGHNGGLRRDTTIELVTQLNEMVVGKDGKHRTKLHRLIKNLVTKATTEDDVLDADGKTVKEGTGDLQAIQENRQSPRGQSGAEDCWTRQRPAANRIPHARRGACFSVRTRHRFVACSASSNQAEPSARRVRPP